MLGVRPRPDLPDRPRVRGADPARPLRRGARPDRPAARGARPLRRRALLQPRHRGFRARQRQPARRRRAALRAHRRPRLPARQPPPDRHGGVGHGRHRRPPRRPVGGPAVDRDGREHGPRARRRRARRPLPLRRHRHAGCARRPRRRRAATSSRRTLDRPSSPARCCRRPSCSRPDAVTLIDLDEALAPHVTEQVVADQARRRARAGREPATSPAPHGCSRTPSASWRRSGSPTSSRSAKGGSTRPWSTLLRDEQADVPAAAVGPVAVERPAPTIPGGGVRLIVMGGPIVVLDGSATLAVPAGNPQRLVGVIAASGGSVTIDQASEALWGDDDIERSRTRLRNVLLRLRRAVGDLVVRTGSGLRLAPGRDLRPPRLPAPRRRTRWPTARADPELAGELARVALGDRDEPVFVDFEYDEWAVAARRAGRPATDQPARPALGAGRGRRRPGRCAGAGRAGAAARPLHATRATSAWPSCSAVQDRVAAAMAVLADADAIAAEVGGAPAAVEGTARRAAAARGRRDGAWLIGRRRPPGDQRPPRGRRARTSVLLEDDEQRSDGDHAGGQAKRGDVSVSSRIDLAGSTRPSRVPLRDGTPAHTSDTAARAP